MDAQCFVKWYLELEEEVSHLKPERERLEKVTNRIKVHENMMKALEDLYKEDTGKLLKNDGFYEVNSKL